MEIDEFIELVKEYNKNSKFGVELYADWDEMKIFINWSGKGPQSIDEAEKFVNEMHYFIEGAKFVEIAMKKVWIR